MLWTMQIMTKGWRYFLLEIDHRREQGIPLKYSWEATSLAAYPAQAFTSISQHLVDFFVVPVESRGECSDGYHS